MWKINYHSESILRRIPIDLALQWVEKHNGIYLFTSNNKFLSSKKNIIGLNPVIKVFPGFTVHGDQRMEKNIFEVLQSILETNQSEAFLPFLLGYFGYDFKKEVEESGLYKELVDERFPLAYFVVCEHYFIFDTDAETAKHIRLSFPFPYETTALSFAFEEIEIHSESQQSSYKGTNMPKDIFCDHVQRIKQYIEQGDIYQANLTREITGETADSFQTLAKKLYYSNIIEFGVFANIDGKFLISTSPERFFKIDQQKIVTSPIKGTIKKTRNKQQNKLQVSRLLSDTKELSELAMIVDLLRNDIGKVCAYNSVQVIDYPKIKELQNVYHLVADIEGKLNTNSIKKIIEGMFPGGSISGCPKIRACQIIEALEQKGRGPYTGSFGYISMNFAMDFNILIRTLFYDSSKIWFNVGGGITLKSIPEKEYEETIYKAASLWEAVNMEYIHQERYCI